jgi:hypothetical protein
MPEIFPMNVVGRGALVLDLLLRLDLSRSRVGLHSFFGLVNVLGNLQPVLGDFLIANVRFVPHPSNAAPTKEPILDAMLHCCAEVGVMLNLKVQRPFDQLGGNPAHRVVVTKPAGYVCLWQVEHRQQESSVWTFDQRILNFAVSLVAELRLSSR